MAPGHFVQAVEQWARRVTAIVFIVDGRIVHKGKRLPAKERVAEILGI